MVVAGFVVVVAAVVLSIQPVVEKAVFVTHVEVKRCGALHLREVL